MGDTISVTARGEAADGHRSPASPPSPTSSRSARPSIAVFDLEAARTLFAKDGYDRILVARDGAEARRGRRVRRCAPRPTDDRFAFASLDTLDRHPAHDPARVRRRSRCSSAPSRSSTRSRSPSPSGRGSSGCCGWSARPAARCAPPCCCEATDARPAGARRRDRRRLRPGSGPAGAVHAVGMQTAQRGARAADAHGGRLACWWARSPPCSRRRSPPGGRRRSRPWPRCATRRSIRAPGRFARGVCGLAGVVGRPAR